MKRQLVASHVCSGIVENTDKIKQPNTRRKLKNKRILKNSEDTQKVELQIHEL